jgi:hypothetical protein
VRRAIFTRATEGEIAGGRLLQGSDHHHLIDKKKLKNSVFKIFSRFS